jgi:phosphoribosylaminoimidazolecarboxamide formyltransferase / IMP cyclohydrolase
MNGPAAIEGGSSQAKQGEEFENRAVLSVSDKSGIVEFARGLREIIPDVRLLSTGGTAKALRTAGVDVTEVADATGFPEILKGRVKTLHPIIHGGILADTSIESHLDDLRKNGISPINFVIVNLYPFEQTVAKPGVTKKEAIEDIDIGGVTLLRAAAKNSDRVVVICDPTDYAPVLEEMRANGGTLSYETRINLAVKAFAQTSRYDGAIDRYLEGLLGRKFPDNLRIAGTRRGEIRYAENPQQAGAIYELDSSDPLAFVNFRVTQGKAMSFNNWLDATAAANAVSYLGGERPAVVIVKHTNLCGASYGSDIVVALNESWDGDPLAAYGGILFTNRPIDVAFVTQMKGRFVEIIAAPEISPEAAAMLAKKEDLRVLINPALINPPLPIDYDLRGIRGGILAQEPDTIEIDPTNWEVLTNVAPTPEQIEDLLFAWQICRSSKSNTITIVKGEKLLGNGVGQQDRKECCKLAVGKANANSVRSVGAVAASDAFFPFPDGPQILIDAGIKAIIQPAGSKRDKETIDLCNEKGIAMVTTGKDGNGNRIRGFRH